MKFKKMEKINVCPYCGKALRIFIEILRNRVKVSFECSNEFGKCKAFRESITWDKYIYPNDFEVEDDPF